MSTAVIPADAAMHSDGLRDVPVVDPKSHLRTIDTQIIAAMAAWLIFNSHLEEYYPRRYMAADGLFGNSLFFMMSGYGIQMSLLGRSQSLAEYYWRRLTRLYPAVLIAVLIFVYGLNHQWQVFGPLDYVRAFIYPTPFTYVMNIIPFYFLLFFFARKRSSRWIAAAIGLGLIAYAYGCLINGATDSDGVWHHQFTSSHIVSRWAQYWTVLCTGAMAAVLSVRSHFSWTRLAGVALLFCLYFGMRGFVIVTGRLPALTIPVDGLVILTCVGVLLTLGSPVWVERLRRVPVLGIFLALSGACTLEIFVLGQSMEGRGCFHEVIFPANIVLLAAMTLLTAIILHHICEVIRKRLERLPRRP